MQHSLASHDPAVLTSWKEIARHLGKGVRTVQRWETQFGLPVKRPNIKSRNVVIASTEDLDAWVRHHGACPSHIPVGQGLAKTLGKNIRMSRHLRKQQKQIVAEWHESVDVFVQQCKQSRIRK